MIDFQKAFPYTIDGIQVLPDWRCHLGTVVDYGGRKFEMHPYDYAAYMGHITGNHDEALTMLQGFIHTAIDRKFAKDKEIAEFWRMWKECGIVMWPSEGLPYPASDYIKAHPLERLPVFNFNFPPLT